MQIENVTNFKVPNLYPVGTVCNLINKIDDSEGTVCTVRLVEQDLEYSDLFWYYLRANDESKNIQFDERIGNYFEIIEYNNARLVPLANLEIDNIM